MPNRAACSFNERSDSARSMSARRAALLSSPASFFFQPRQLRGEPADLGVEVMDLLLMSGLARRLVLGGLIGEQTGQASEGLVAPAVKLVGMQTVFGSQLVDRLLLAEDLLH